MVAMAAILAACFLSGTQPSLVILGVFAAIGLIAGVFQNLAIRRNPDLFRSANSALKVRAALVRSVHGKASVSLLWLSAIALILLLVYGDQYATVQTMVGLYAIFSFAREAVAFPSLFVLQGV